MAHLRNFEFFATNEINIIFLFVHFRADTGTALQDMDNATILSELEAQGEDVMRQWSSLLSQTLQQQTNNSNTINNNVNAGSANNNNQPANDIGCVFKILYSFIRFLTALYSYPWFET